MDLTDLDIAYDRSGTGPDDIVIQLSSNGGAFVTIFTDTTVSSSGETNLDIDLSPFTTVTSATFRLYGFNASSGAGTFDPENDLASGRAIEVNGIASIPEPSAALLGAIAMFGAAVIRRRRRKSTSA